MRRNHALALLWLAGALLLTLGLPWFAAGFVTLMLWPFIFPTWLAAGIVMAAVAAWRAARDPGRPARPAILLCGLMVVAAVAIVRGRHRLFDSGESLFFRAHRGAYESFLRELQSRPASGAMAGEHDGLAFETDSGPPLRIAFPWISWLGDWEGVIYDPADILAGNPLGNGPRLFGRQIFNCRRLAEHWYRCATGD